MGGALRSVLEKVGLREPDIDDYDDVYEDEETEAMGEVHEFPHSTEVNEPLVSPTESPRVVPKPVTRTIDRIKTFKPTAYADAREMGDYLREGVPVILNISYLNAKESQRIVDFAYGLSYGVYGSFEEVGTNVFLLSPANLSTIEETPQRPAPFTQTI